MAVDIAQDGDAVPTPKADEVALQIVAAYGELDLATGPALRDELEEIMEEGATGVVVDLDAVTFMDSSGLGALVEALRYARANQLSFSIRGPRPQVRRVLEITGVDRILPIAT